MDGFYGMGGKLGKRLPAGVEQISESFHRGGNPPRDDLNILPVALIQARREMW
jgi:hypothetical protein